MVASTADPDMYKSIRRSWWGLSIKRRYFINIGLKLTRIALIERVILVRFDIEQED